MRSTTKPRPRMRSRSAPLTRKPLLFISHDTRERSLAKAFANLMQGTTGGALETFCSSDARGASGIEFGAEWFPTIIGKIEEATDMVVLLTPESIDRSWLMFEAGVARGVAKARIFGVLVRVELEQAAAGPFHQFQNCGDDEESLTRLVSQLINRNLGGKPLESAVRSQVREFRSEIDFWARQPVQPRPRAGGQDTSARVLEEVKLLAGGLRKNGSAKLLGPKLSEEFPLYAGGGDAAYDCTGWLILIGCLRDELPWFFELGLELHRALSDGDPARVAGAKERLLKTLRQAARNDWLRSVLADSNRELTFRLYHLPDIVADYLRELDPARKHGAKTGKARVLRPAGKPSHGQSG